jgi:hypothetical protein
MAENADTAPGTHPDAVVVNDDGTVTAHGRRAFVWVHDESTGARYDVPATMLPRTGLRPVEGYPVNRRPHARPAKPAVLLGDLPVTAGRVITTDNAPELTGAVAAARAAAAASSVSTEPVAPAGLDSSTSDAGATPATEPAVSPAGDTTTETGEQPAGEPAEATAGGDAGDAAAAESTTTTKARRSAR